MIIKYALKRLRSGFWEMAVATVTVFLCLMLILFLNSLVVDRQADLNDTYENTEIACVVTNATGTAETGLELSSEYAALVREGGALSDCVSDVACHAVAAFLLLGDTQIPFHLITSPRAVGMFEQTEITYMDGCSEADFLSGEAVAVIAESLLPSVAPDGTLTLGLPPYHADSITFRVVGTCQLDTTEIYVPFDTGKEFMERNQRQFELDSLSFMVADNRELNRIKMRLSDYFIAANRVNQESQRPGLLMDDAVFVDTVTVLERSIALFTLFQTVLFLLSIGICFFVTFLLIRRRRSELAVMRSLGCRSRLIYGQMLFEQLLAFAVGALIALLVTAVLKLSRDTGAWFLTGGLLVCWVVSSILSVAAVTSGDIMKILKGKE